MQPASVRDARLGPDVPEVWRLVAPLMMADVVTHRLVAILSADGVNYSRHMALDEASTLVALLDARSVFSECAVLHDGQIVNFTGDAALAVFPTAAGAVSAAIAAQQIFSTKLNAEETLLQFRIGLHIGDVTVHSDGSVYGSGVNIAARLESIAPAGGIMVSEAIRAAVEGQSICTFIGRGEHEVKGATRRIHAYEVESLPLNGLRQNGRQRLPLGGVSRAVGFGLLAIALVLGATWRIIGADSRDRSTLVNATASVDPLIGKGIAILPFVGVGDPDSESFAIGMSDELTSTLSRQPRLRVTPRASSDFFKGKGDASRPSCRTVGRYLHRNRRREEARSPRKNFCPVS